MSSASSFYNIDWSCFCPYVLMSVLGHERSQSTPALWLEAPTLFCSLSQVHDVENQVDAHHVSLCICSAVEVCFSVRIAGLQVPHYCSWSNCKQNAEDNNLPVKLERGIGLVPVSVFDYSTAAALSSL